MRSRRWMILVMLCVLLLGGLMAASATQAATKKEKKYTYSQALAYIKKNQPATMNLGQVSFTPEQLLTLKNAMPKGGTLNFTTTWENVKFGSGSKSIDMRGIRKTPTKAQLKAIVQVCPKCTLINLHCRRAPANSVMGALADQYPHVRFGWTVSLGGKYSLSSLDSAFSTLIGSRADPRLNDKDMENLKYCKYLKALDVGHNRLFSLDFLKYVPNLEMLIVACNHLTDITPLAQLKHLQYLELFTNKVTDLTPLKECTELVDLNIANTRITSLEALDGLTRLRRLWAISCEGLSRQEISRFKKLHPACKTRFPGERLPGPGAAIPGISITAGACCTTSGFPLTSRCPPTKKARCPHSGPRLTAPFSDSRIHQGCPAYRGAALNASAEPMLP